jgi:predicted site-specific integrase-resolvase
MKNDLLYTATVTAKKIGVSYKTLYIWILKEKVKPIRIDNFGKYNRYYFTQKQIDNIRKTAS